VCWQLDILCGSVRGSAGCCVLNCMYCCVLAVGHFVWECEGVSREWRNELYVLLCVGSWTYVWECEGFSREWSTEFYVLLCVCSWTYVWECEGLSREWLTELYVLLCVGSWTFCAGV